MLEGIKYRDDIHQYSNRDNKVYISATTLLGLYKNKFEDLKDFWAFYKGVQKALGRNYEERSAMSGLYMRNGGKFKDLNLQSDIVRLEPLVKICTQFDISTKAVLGQRPELFSQWKAAADYACARGTRYHDKKEKEALESGFDSINGIIAPTQYKYTFDLSELTDGFHSELMLYNHEYEIAGRADKVIIETDLFGDRWMLWDDYKTNKKISMTNAFTRMKYPIQHLDDCNGIHYALQINLYEWMLKQFGYKTKHRKITWVILNEVEESVKEIDMIIPDLQKEVVAMVNHYKETVLKK